jgi:hypothetical protein
MTGFYFARERREGVDISATGPRSAPADPAASPMVPCFGNGRWTGAGLGTDMPSAANIVPPPPQTGPSGVCAEAPLFCQWKGLEGWNEGLIGDLLCQRSYFAF